jgi:hypothetical protein
LECRGEIDWVPGVGHDFLEFDFHPSLTVSWPNVYDDAPPYILLPRVTGSGRRSLTLNVETSGRSAVVR